jgi:hypothetical protein
MTDRETRAIPSFVWVAVIATVALHLAEMAMLVAKTDWLWLGMRVQLATEAMGPVMGIVVGLAIAHLGRRLTGAAAIGARIAAWAIAVSIGLYLVRAVYEAFDQPYDRDLYEVFWYAKWIVGLTVTIGLIVAARNSRTLMIVGGVLALLVNLPPIAWEKLSEAMRGEEHNWIEALDMLVIACGASGWLILLHGAARTETPLPSLAIRGFRLASRGVWLRVIAAIAGVCVTFMMFTANHGSGKGIQTALLAALVVTMLSFAMFGIGAIQVACAKLDGMPRFALGLAGVLSLWCAGLMSFQGRWFLRWTSMRSALFDDNFIGSFSIALPLVGTLAAALLAGGVAVFANAKGDAGGLGRQARSAGIAIVCLMVFGLVAQYGLIRAASSALGAAMVMLLAAVCVLIAQVALAQLCSAASNAIESEPVIPTATVRP